MQFCRIYTGQDGQSHFEDLDQNEGAANFMQAHVAKALVFKNDFNREDLHGWHNAPRRQWCITLSGAVTIGIGDGSHRTFLAGDVFLAEDVAGHGHTALPKDWVRAFIHLE
jgi:quercetin dioxygenase-like cupin family protein